VKTPLANLVLVLALALCGLCAFQWVRESRLRTEVVSLQETNQVQAQSLVSAETLARRYESEIARLDSRVKELKQIEQTNSVTIASLKISLKHSEEEAELLRKQVANYKEAVDRQNESITKQNAIITQQNVSIKEQNENLKRLAEERNELVGTLNARTKEFNDVVAKYNDLVKQVEQLQNKGASK